MTIREFKKVIIRANWYDKYFYYLLGFSIVAVGFFFIYDRLENPSKYYSENTHFFIFIAAFCFIFIGAFALYKLPNRYKVLSFDSILAIESKKQVVSVIMKEFGNTFSDNDKHIWSFEVKPSWSTRYIVWLGFDETQIYASVILGTIGQNGFIDFGGAEKFRAKLSKMVSQNLE